MPSYILAIDQGTTGTRVLVVDKKGVIKVRSYREFPQYFPRPGWVEHNPHGIFEGALEVAREAFRHSGIQPSEIAAIGITNQRETTVLWDRVTGRALHKAIVWQDRRTSDFCDKLRKLGCERHVRNKTGLFLDPYFSGTKVRWLLRHIPGAGLKVKRGRLLFGTMDTWLLWNLTGGQAHATDYSNASRTLLFNIRTRSWDKELLSLFGVPASCLPESKPSVGYFGRTVKIGPFPSGIPIYGMVGDQQAALYGQGCYEPGTIKNTYGTGCFVVLNTGSRWVLSKKGLVTTLACDRWGKPVFALEGSIFIGGAVMQWIRDGLGIIKKASDSEKLAASVSDTGGVYVVPAFVGLGAPYWDSHARGAILGITRGTRREHIVRAALDSIAYQTVDVIRAMRADSQLRIRELKVDGGATQNRYLMQFQADMLGFPVKRTSVLESTAWGAAKLAGIGAGFWRDTREIDGALRYRPFRPRFSDRRRKETYQGWLKSVARVLSPAG